MPEFPRHQLASHLGQNVSTALIPKWPECVWRATSFARDILWSNNKGQGGEVDYCHINRFLNIIVFVHQQNAATVIIDYCNKTAWKIIRQDPIQ